MFHHCMYECACMSVSVCMHVWSHVWIPMGQYCPGMADVCILEAMLATMLPTLGSPIRAVAPTTDFGTLPIRSCNRHLQLLWRKHSSEPCTNHGYMYCNVQNVCGSKGVCTCKYVALVNVYTNALL